MRNSKSSSPAPRVTFALGIVDGARMGEVESFKGMRFAAPPIGALRWRAPQPPAPWTGVQRALQYGADPMQQPFAEDLAPLRTEPAEDCLFLNVWRPAGAHAGDRLPVVVWFYGGGYVNGGTSPAVYEGDAFAAAGQVLVSFNYRLGHLGFFAHPALTHADADEGFLGNYGHMDQIAALHWVQRHIDAFGGDAGNVTLIGESAGGGSVIAMMTSPMTTHLLHKAVVLSGGGRGLLDGARRVSQDSEALPSGETLGLRFAARHGIEGDGAGALAALRALPAAAIVQGLQIPTLSFSRDIFAGPMVDDRVVVDAPSAIAAGRWAKVPALVGTTAQEVGVAAFASKAEAFAAFGADADAAAAAFDPRGDAGLADVNARIGMTRKMHEPARHLAGLIRTQGQPAYLSRFSYVAETMRATWRDGAVHASDIPYFLNRLAGAFGAAVTPADQALATAAHRCIVRFAAQGEPNGAASRETSRKAAPHWDRFEPGDTRLLDFAADGRIGMAEDPLTPRIDVIARRAAAA